MFYVHIYGMSDVDEDDTQWQAQAIPVRVYALSQSKLFRF